MEQAAVLISVIMPVFNAEKYLANALDKIQQQQFTNYELLIVDGLSTDATAAIVQQALASNKAIRWFSQKDKGIYDAMNFGIAKATGEWLYFMGADDSFHNDTVLSEIAPHLSSEQDLVYGDIKWLPGGEMESGSCRPNELFHRNINHQRIFYRKSLFEQFGNYELKYTVASDHELNIRFFCNEAVRKKYVPLLIADYHSGGFSANRLDPVFWSEWKSIFKKHFLKHIPGRMMYDKLGWYSRYLIDRREYKKAFPIFVDVLTHRFTPGLLWLTGKHLLQSFKKHAG